MTTPFHRQLAGALAGLNDLAAAHSLSALAPEALLVALAAYGDALRLDMPTPGAFLPTVRALPVETLQAALGALGAEIDTWGWMVALDPGEPEYAWALRCRDHAESVVVAVRRVLGRRDEVGALADALDAVEDRMAGLDFTQGGTVPAAEMVRLLGERAALVAGASWVSP
jgi:hypothetical protein